MSELLEHARNLREVADRLALETNTMWPFGPAMEVSKKQLKLATATLRANADRLENAHIDLLAGEMLRHALKARERGDDPKVAALDLLEAWLFEGRVNSLDQMADVLRRAGDQVSE